MALSAVLASASTRSKLGTAGRASRMRACASERGCMSRKLRLVRTVRHPRILLGAGQPSDQSYRRGREESRRKKRLNWQILLAAPRARAAVPLASVWGKSGASRSSCGRRGSCLRRAPVIPVDNSCLLFPSPRGSAEASVVGSSLGMLWTASGSGLGGLPLASFSEWHGRKGTAGALTGCGQELPWLKLERPEKSKAAEE
ncbi:uncharacterized protein WM294_001836 [Sarcoramphus papa]